MCSSATVSVIITVHNGREFLDECLESILGQTFDDPFEVSVYDDASTDGSMELAEQWRISLESRSIALIISRGSVCKGVGFGRNRAVEQVFIYLSTFFFFCFKFLFGILLLFVV